MCDYRPNWTLHQIMQIPTFSISVHYLSACFSRDTSVHLVPHITESYIFCNFKVFAGNTDKSTIVSHVLSPAINARYIRVQPKTWNEYISMRIELVGCHTGNYIKQVSDHKVS